MLGITCVQLHTEIIKPVSTPAYRDIHFSFRTAVQGKASEPILMLTGLRALPKVDVLLYLEARKATMGILQGEKSTCPSHFLLL